MKTKSLYPSLAALAVASTLSCAAGIEPLKELRAPDKTKWTVTVQTKASLKEAVSNTGEKAAKAKLPPPRALVQSIGEKDGEIYRVLNRYDNQTGEEFWILPQFQYLKATGRERIVRFLPSHPRSWNLEEADFPELYWAVGQTPELQEIEGKKMLVIKMDAAKRPLTKRQQRALDDLRQAMKQAGENGDSSPAAAAGTLVLYLDPETRLPIRFKDIDRTYSYSFEKSAGLRQVIPEEMKKEIIDWDKLLAKLTRPPGAPKIRNRQSE